MITRTYMSPPTSNSEMIFVDYTDDKTGIVAHYAIPKGCADKLPKKIKSFKELKKIKELEFDYMDYQKLDNVARDLDEELNEMCYNVLNNFSFEEYGFNKNIYKEYKKQKEKILSAMTEFEKYIEYSKEAVK